MYWATPFKYLLEGMLGLVIHDIPVVCADTELAKFRAPPGQTCQSYVGQYAKQVGGYVTSLDNGLCGFCQYATGDAFGRSFNVYYRYVWRDYGIFWGFCVFNIVVVFLCSWLYLQGGQKVIRTVRPAARKERKALKEREREASGEKA